MREISELASYLKAGRTRDELVDALVSERDFDRRRAVSLVSSAEQHLLDEQQGPAAYKDIPWGRLIFGPILILVGIVISVASCTSAEGGGSYIIWWGLPVTGAFMLISAIIQLTSDR